MEQIPYPRKLGRYRYGGVSRPRQNQGELVATYHQGIFTDYINNVIGKQKTGVGGIPQTDSELCMTVFFRL